MGKIEITDEFLYEHIPAYAKKVLNAMPKEEDIEYEFSEEFEKKMQILIKKVKQKEKYHIPVSRWKRAVAAVFIILAATLTITFSVQAVREKVVDFIKTIYETYISTVYYSDEDVVGEFVPMYSGYIPEGYELTINDEGSYHLVQQYEKRENDNTEYIMIYQEQIQNLMEITDDNEYVKEEKYMIAGVEARISYKENGTIRLHWEKDNCMYMISATSLSKYELIRIGKSLQ